MPELLSFPAVLDCLNGVVALIVISPGVITMCEDFLEYAGTSWGSSERSRRQMDKFCLWMRWVIPPPLLYLSWKWILSRKSYRFSSITSTDFRFQDNLDTWQQKIRSANIYRDNNYLNIRSCETGYSRLFNLAWRSWILSAQINFYHQFA